MDISKTQLLVSLLTILASGVVSGIVTFRLNSRRDARRLRRSKLEEFYSAHSAFIRQLSADWLLHMNVMRNQISYVDALDIIVNREKAPDPPFERAETLVALYFPVTWTPKTDPALMREQRLVEWCNSGGAAPA